ncbi:class I adenylate-forming enzyme family protein [Promethearchaeum syntrophicum]|uniref:Class I adenylate-forming enzyme family protein n=1 Tax=Promethearchaeum syntrophicum TaxID=2594042 RepID=A0A5B9DFV9_9ARCH|nr:class I adenylate-forming enzyme family protein [Candidatus Prometheoarchaeum syntrophicum]QEE17935.1 3-hydroxypropionyl-coenzyme A synthetase [Candidatus Prometheoarchaeum syntrophicum]
MDKECIERYDEMKKSKNKMFDWLDYWAKKKPNEIALIEYNTGAEITWKDFATKSKAFAAKLLSMGIGKGDVVATTLVLLKEHVYLMYACYRIGAIIAPLDPRLKVSEVDYCFSQMKPKAYLFLGPTPNADFSKIAAAMMEKYSEYCKIWIQFTGEQAIQGAQLVKDFAIDIKKIYIIQGLLLGKVKKAQKKVKSKDPCLIIFTTGSTGKPKPALLSHKAILVQNISLMVGFGMNESDRMIINLPPSHVGCTTEQLSTTIYGGGVSVLLHIYTPENSLDAVQKYKATLIGQIPALFAMEWRLPNYNDYDISSLRFALYGGQSVTRKFLEQLKAMAPLAGTGLGLTETAGFVTYSPLDGTVDDILASVGYDSPLYPISIREPLKPDGYAGDEKPKGIVGDVCFKGPQNFSGYLNNPEQTAQTISKDGYLYTGDLGTYDEKGLHFAGRAKFVIKPKGYQVYPPAVEEFLMAKLKDKLSAIAIVGAPHEVFSEGIVCYVEQKPGSVVSDDDVNTAAQEMASYKRPSHVVILEQGGIPLNRVAKTDYKTLSDMAKDLTEKLRSEGKWDAE